MASWDPRPFECSRDDEVDTKMVITVYQILISVRKGSLIFMLFLLIDGAVGYRLTVFL